MPGSASRSAMSPANPAASMPSAASSTVKASSRVGLRATRATWNPSRPNRRATERPMPGPAPNTAMVLVMLALLAKVIR